MSKKVLDRIRQELGDALLETSDFRGDEVAVVAPSAWVRAATFLRDDPKTRMDHFVDLTAVDYPEREPELPRFDVLLLLRSSELRHRIRLRARLEEGKPMPTLTGVFAGANWAEREVFDMFGICFEGHPDLRRILLYEEFEGHPLRKDYPIERAQPLVPYRDAGELTKLPPFGVEEGQPWGRIDWQERLEGRDQLVSPSIAVQQGRRRTISDSEAAIPIAPAQTPASED
ncbi:MAG: NADH-quinone oxidoreductase subunit C [Myxococcales bacterium]|nr:NADH-quinone oxidoreductase subunit C [Myxococcales bacterium]